MSRIAGTPRAHRRLPNPHRVKIHRNYTVEEAAALLGAHKNTVRRWVQQGLPVIDTRRPTLILGAALSEFLHKRRGANKRPCQPGEIYCVRCRVPQKPAGGMADYLTLSPRGGNLVGICPTCETVIYRRVSYARLHQDCGDLDLCLPKALEHIDESGKPSVNSDFK